MLQKGVIFFVFLFFAGIAAHSQVPRLISYQGYLTDASGVALNGSFNVTFNLYAAQNGGTALWSETQNVTVSKGLFNANLGSVAPLNIQFDKPYFLGLSVANGSELTPRIALTSSPYSLNPQQFPVPIELFESLDVPVIDITNNGAGSAIFGQNTKSNTWNYGILGSLTEEGVYGKHSSKNYGFLGNKDYGVFGKHDSTRNYGYIGSEYFGVYGKHNLSGNFGFLASNDYGVYGKNAPFESYGYLGGDSCGVFGSANDAFSGFHVGVYGEAGNNFGYLGSSDYGAYAENYYFNTYAYLASQKTAVYGYQGEEKNYGYLGGEEAGAYGYNNRQKNEGWLGDGLAGVHGINITSANSGMLGTNNSGVVGSGTDYGVAGYSENGKGVFGKHDPDGNYGHIGSSLFGVYGMAKEDASYAVYGENEGSGNIGALGLFNRGVYGEVQSFVDFAIRGWNEGGKVFGYIGGLGMGVYGKQSEDMNKWGYLGGATYSGAFGEDVWIGRNCQIVGNLTKSGGQFHIDHPLDPANKYLNHSFVESPERTNIYNGNVVLDNNGEATIEMPDWFEALNKDFRYQLTAIGTPGPGLYIAKEINNNQFSIAGGTPGLKVSWMVTGVRHDAWAEANPLVVEENKDPDIQGFYVHPELFGQPKEMQIEFGRNPELMKSVTLPSKKSNVKFH